jgi:hypothetical protein
MTSRDTRTGVVFHDVQGPKEEVHARGGGPKGEQGEFETRKLWAAVSRGIREGDFEAASREKGKIEVGFSGDALFGYVLILMIRG